MTVLFTNNATSMLASSVTTGATTLSVTAGEGGKFPSPSGGSWFPLTLIKPTGALEILRCTGRSIDVLTVVRAQEGTVAQAFSAGDRVELRLTMAALQDIQQSITDLTAAALLDLNNLSDLSHVPTARNNLGLSAAAITPLTSSQVDMVPGHIMKVGDHGLMLWLDGRDTTFEDGVPQAYFGTGETWALARGGADGLQIPGLGGNVLGIVHISAQYIDNTGRAAISRTFTTNSRHFIQSAASALTWSAWTEFHTAESLPISAFMRTLLDDVDQTTARTTLGVPPGIRKQMCSAWVSFSGVGTVTVTGAFNVSSVTDLGVGQYRVNFAEPMTEEYAVVANAGNISSTARRLSHGAHNLGSVDVGNAGITDAYAPIDNEFNSVVILGGRV